MTLTPQPPVETPVQAAARRQIRKARSAMATNPQLPPAYLADERQYRQWKRSRGED